MDEPVDASELREILVAALGRTGGVAFTRHALDEMDEDGLDELDIRRVLGRGRWDGCDFERGSWRYCWRIPGVVAVVAIIDADRVRIVTAWRER
ncbi:MAG: DUF4258 domain-containing protein [Myxococcota bacterium]